MTMSVPMRLAAGLNRIGLLRGPYPQSEFAHKRQREASDRYDAVGKLSQVSAPTLIAHGHRDKTTPLLLAEQLQAGITDSELAVFRGGHMFFLFSERRRLIDRIESFLGTAGGVRIRGPRLLLRPFRPIEIDDEWQAMLTADPMTVGMLPDEGSFRARLRASGSMRNGWIDLAIDLGGESIGRIQTFVPGNQPLPPGTFEVGIGLRAVARGQGYGREALSLCTDWLFDHAGAEVIEAPTDPANIAMRTVFDRVGWRQTGLLTEAGREWVVYRITRADRQAAGR